MPSSQNLVQAFRCTRRARFREWFAPLDSLQCLGLESGPQRQSHRNSCWWEDCEEQTRTESEWEGEGLEWMYRQERVESQQAADIHSDHIWHDPHCPGHIYRTRWRIHLVEGAAGWEEAQIALKLDLRHFCKNINRVKKNVVNIEGLTSTGLTAGTGLSINSRRFCWTRLLRVLSPESGDTEKNKRHENVISCMNSMKAFGVLNIVAITKQVPLRADMFLLITWCVRTGQNNAIQLLDHIRSTGQWQALEYYLIYTVMLITYEASHAKHSRTDAVISFGQEILSPFLQVMVSLKERREWQFKIISWSYVFSQGNGNYHSFYWLVGGFCEIPLFQLSDWRRNLCVLKDPPLNHNSLWRRWTHDQKAVCRFTARPQTKKQDLQPCSFKNVAINRKSRSKRLISLNTWACRFCWVAVNDLDVVHESS